MVEIKEAWPVFLGRLQRNAGPVAPSMGAFANHLLEAGYSPHTIKRSLLLAARFGHWLHSRPGARDKSPRAARQKPTTNLSLSSALSSDPPCRKGGLPSTTAFTLPTPATLRSICS